VSSTASTGGLKGYGIKAVLRTLLFTGCQVSPAIIAFPQLNAELRGFGVDEITQVGTQEIETTLVTMVFLATNASALSAVLSRYVVLTRGEIGCRNVDFCVSSTQPNRFVIVQKWTSPDAARAHFDSAPMIEMAKLCNGLLDTAPQVDLLDTISAHDMA
jgi:quinol monooxygenase YgiN